MKERPILMSAPMVRAILAGTKTQTRRALKPQPTANRPHDGGTTWVREGDLHVPVGSIGHLTVREKMGLRCPHGQPGDRLWVRESFQPLLADGVEWHHAEYSTGTGYAVSYPATDGVREFYDMANDNAFCSRITPSIHMPRWASRITLEITGVRVERLQDISARDSVAEGLHRLPATGRYVVNPGDQYFGMSSSDPRDVYRDLWEQINGPGSWDANPWVWVIECKRLPA